MEQIVAWLVEKIGQMGYWGIVALMFLESSFFPFPSEVVMPPAGYLASQGRLSFTLSIVSGILGSLLGALFNYYLAMKWGRPALLKYGRYFFISQVSFEKAEKFFERHGHISTFVGRLLPGIRQYISLPAGLLRMSMPRFVFYTGLGSGIWVTVLTLLGFLVGENKELLRRYLSSSTTALVIFSVTLVLIYVLVQRSRKRRPKA